MTASLRGNPRRKRASQARRFVPISPHIALALAVLLVCACGPKAPGGSAPPTPLLAAAYEGPPVGVDVLQMESFPVQWAAVARAEVPTGGWRFVLDGAAVSSGTLELRATLEAPGADEFVTQALETLTVRHGTGTTPIEHVRVVVRRVRRGEPAVDADYRLAVQTPKR
jgi:hypothetical protein